MTFRFEKIGPVDHADITLGDLTIIAGRNNTGKTYVVYALYGFLMRWRGWPMVDSFFESLAERGHAAAAMTPSRIARALAKSDQATVRVAPDVLANVRQDLVDQLAEDFSVNALSDVFSASPEVFVDARMSIDLSEDELSQGHLPKVVLDYPRTGRMQLEHHDQEIVLSIERDRAPSPEQTGFRLGMVRDIASRLLFLSFCHQFPQPFILCSERFGISLFYKELDFTRSQLVDRLQKMSTDNERNSRDPFLLIDRNTSRYTRPIKDNIDSARNIHDIQKKRSPLLQDKLFDEIKNLMGGYYRASRDAVAFRSEARKRGFDIPLHLASSSARGLADLYFYLRHTAATGDLLIIDEPESHLDTGNQVRLARILARFVHAGIKVLITTHSDYVIKEINNLIMLGELGDHGNIRRTLKYSEYDSLKASSVRAYVADNHSLVPTVVDEFGIDMPVFDKTIDSINQASRKLAAEVQRQREQG